MQEFLDLTYSSNFTKERMVDVFTPEQGGNGACILFIHGGGWAGGSRDKWHEVARHFCNRGYVCASAGYRLAPAYVFPAQVEDVRLAMAFLRANAKRFGFDRSRIAVMGSSAGGHLAAMLGTVGPQDRVGCTDELVDVHTRPAACICFCPLTYVQLWDNSAESVPAMLRKFMGVDQELEPGLYSAASPADRVTGDEPPFLFVHGDTDALIPVEHSKVMAARLTAKGAIGQLVVLQGAAHGFGYGTSTPHQIEALRATTEFLNKYL